MYTHKVTLSIDSLLSFTQFKYSAIFSEGIAIRAAAALIFRQYSAVVQNLIDISQLPHILPMATPNPSARQQLHCMLKIPTPLRSQTRMYIVPKLYSTPRPGPIVQGTNRTRPDETSKKRTKSQSYTLEILSAPAQALLRRMAQDQLQEAIYLLLHTFSHPGRPLPVNVVSKSQTGFHVVYMNPSSMAFG